MKQIISVSTLKCNAKVSIVYNQRLKTFHSILYLSRKASNFRFICVLPRRKSIDAICEDIELIARSDEPKYSKAQLVIPYSLIRALKQNIIEKYVEVM